MHNKYEHIGVDERNLIFFSSPFIYVFSAGIFESPVKCEGIWMVTVKMDLIQGSSKHGSILLAYLGSKFVRKLSSNE